MFSVKYYNLAKRCLQTIDYNLEERFYTILTEKSGINTLSKLRYSRECLSALVKAFYSKYNSVNYQSQHDIDTWKDIRELSFFISGLKEIRGLKKIIILFLMTSKLKSLTNSEFRRALNIWFNDWSPFSKSKYFTENKLN